MIKYDEKKAQSFRDVLRYHRIENDNLLIIENMMNFLSRIYGIGRTATRNKKTVSRRFKIF